MPKDRRIQTFKMHQESFYSDFVCPICHLEQDKLLIAICGHLICERCKSEMFRVRQEQTINCPFCRRILRKRDISEKSLEESTLENEIRIRDILIIEFSEKLEDFETEQEYHDYKELFEVIVLLKMNGNEREVSTMIKEYRNNKAERKKAKERKEKMIASKGIITLIDLDKLKYPVLITDVSKREPYDKNTVYKAGGYDLRKINEKYLYDYLMLLKSP